jgi:antitoxin CptB
MGADLEARRKRLLFRSLRRGTKESDLVFGGFARRHLAHMDEGQLDRYEALLEQSDPDVLAWVLGVEPPPAAYDTDVLAMLRRFRNACHRP